jgi:hypothetical protein
MKKKRPDNYQTFYTSENNYSFLIKEKRTETATVEALNRTDSIRVNSGFQSIDRLMGTSLN